MTKLLLSLPEDPVQIGKGITLVTVLDVNDNAPVFATDYETLLCENTPPGQVRGSAGGGSGPWRCLPVSVRHPRNPSVAARPVPSALT